MRASTFLLGIGITLAAMGHAAAQTDPQTLFDRGVQLHDAGDFAAAAEVLAQARDAGYPARMPLNLRLARAQARAGLTDDALATLRWMVDNQYGQADALTAENDFLSIRTDPRWSAIVTTARSNQRPCAANPLYRQFDYWLGEWDVEVRGQRVARSSVQLILGECTLFENYWRLDGTYEGKSFSVWDRQQQRWEQRYVDTAGNSGDWFGALENGTMVFYQRPDANGGTASQRMTYTREGADRVRQTIETSSDGEKTWAPGFDGLYIRRK